MKTYTPTFGSDLELFTLSNKTKGIQPPVFLLGDGEEVIIKNNFPYRTYYKETKFSVTSDGCAFEFIVQPENTFLKMRENVSLGIQKLKEMIPSDVSVAIVPHAKLKNRDYFCRETLLTGCGQDFDAVKEIFNTCYVMHTLDETHRFAGGHIHLGVHNEDVNYVHEFILPLVQFLGLTVSIPAFLLSNEPEGEMRRKNSYGNLFNYRPTSYGIELRGPSNNWASNKKLAELLEKNIVTSLSKYFYNPTKVESVLEKYLEDSYNAFRFSIYDELENIYRKLQKEIALEVLS